MMGILTLPLRVTLRGRYYGVCAVIFILSGYGHHLLSFRCRGRYLELQRQQQVITQDTRFIKLQEIERYSRPFSGSRNQAGYFNEDESSRIPKTFEIECRGAHLINFQCGTGDVLQVIGIVRSVQERPRYQGGGGGRGGQKAESGLHNITVIANSLTKLPTSLLSVASVLTANSLYSHSYLTMSSKLADDAAPKKRPYDAINSNSAKVTAVESRSKSVRNQLLDGINRLIKSKNTEAQCIVPNLLNLEVGISEDEDQDVSPRPNASGSRHKSTGLYILDENFQRNTAVNALVGGDVVDQDTNQDAKPLDCLIDIKAFETDDINSYSSGADITNSNLFSSTDMNDIRRVAHLPSRILLPLLLNSFCPTIYGNELVKLGLLLGLLGGSSTDAASGKDGMHIRADIHVLMCGDPGLGKSQLLRAVNTIAPRCITVCGNSTTTAGLTVTLVKEPGCTGNMSGNDVAMEAGALVLADRGPLFDFPNCQYCLFIFYICVLFRYMLH